ncbi:helix-turn-helix transcriptional regulator [Acinetobacter gerneri]|uniref:AraC family transcriptional regulator n=1 Tax=Acinetobacter gerneri TaxID=202952 RepID=UPI002936C30E|nr:helix-turn-helix transcriptional regulator [Acinetobacter gerneri]MDV2439887.1 helix-turn-helix transcriptional regulator [Acinetobacter gerneri]
MKQISIHSIEHLEQAIIAIDTQYADFYILDWHSHLRGQLLYGAEGVIHIETPHGNWIIPPERAVWIPPNVPHKLKMYQVRTCSLYIEASQSPRAIEQCSVLSVSPLLRQLLLKAPELKQSFSHHDTLIFDLILCEIANAEEIQLHLPLPTHPLLLKICQDFIHTPNIHLSPEQIASQLNMSERHFSRIFKQEVGMSFSKWRQHACVLLSLEKIIQNQSIQNIAFEFGFQNPAAFTTMFHRILGISPSRYFKNC